MPRRFLPLLALTVFAALGLRAEDPSPAPPPATPPPAADTPTSDAQGYDPDNEVPAAENPAGLDPAETGALFDAAHQLWQDYVPDALKDDYAFPTREQWDSFFLHLRDALDTDSFARAAELAPDVRDSVAALKQDPAYAQYSDWLDEKLDLLDAAVVAAALLPGGSVPGLTPTGTPAEPTLTPGPTPMPTPPGLYPTALPPTPRPFAATPAPTPAWKPTPIGQSDGEQVPYYSVWLQRIQSRPVPSRASELLPSLKRVFADEGVPQGLVWLAEVESSLNPGARSPAGAQGLFQLMPATARNYGLSTFPFDERSHPEKSARAAARHLKRMRAKFGDWPLALAAYNAGDGRVSRLLKAKGPNATFADIAPSLSVETRMYVPKVLATVAVREGAALN
ncbi:lytic transglycosylase domain-containing protein [Nibricoccus sp. IMCC34717]|uniref:lytic transglycosylase domain-containing protein n=1 Tax=Nibricoccus sp. IMCC34717 TaxID=3034021 RepID=UPI00384A6F82